MICAWKELLDVLPLWMRSQVAEFENSLIDEIRLRCESPPELVVSGKSIWLCRNVTRNDLSFCINAASQYSPWSAASVSQGFLTSAGGHRIGVCGEAIMKNGSMTGIRSPTSLCIRVAKDLPGIADPVSVPEGSVLILGAPGWGKTTLLRDLSRKISQHHVVAVVDERQELFPNGFRKGKRMDVLAGCPKGQGIETVLRTMGPDWIAVDEITAAEDCTAMLHAVGCGVRLLATAHASGIDDLFRRPVYSVLHREKVFDYFLILHKDRSFRLEEAA